jgi:hypothetical protein
LAQDVLAHQRQRTRGHRTDYCECSR